MLLTGCAAGAAASGNSTPAASQNVNNIRVCDHYRTQRAYVKNLAEPSMSDALKFATWVAADAAEATHGTTLARDLNAMSAAQQKLKSAYAASKRVVQDCEALGVKFQP